MYARLISVEEFAAYREPWQALLLKSKADPMFLSWDWHYNWWQVFANKELDKLVLLAVFTKPQGEQEIGTLVGLAPLYLSKAKLSGLIPVNRLQFIGTRLSGGAGFRCEYMQFISLPEFESEVVDLVFQYLLQNYSIDEIVLSDLIVQSPTYKVLESLVVQGGFYSRIQSESVSWGVDCDQELASYLQQLGKNTRLKFYNRRNVLTELGQLCVEAVDINTIDTLFDCLTEYHEFRWGRSIDYDAHKLHLKLAGVSEFIVVTGLLIKLDGKVVGCTLDLSCHGRIYNIQLGFADDLSSKLSMGLMTLGYAIESAINNSEVCYYDLLAGDGKNTNYKSRIANANIQMKTVQVIVSPIMRAIYRLKDKIQDIRAASRST